MRQHRHGRSQSRARVLHLAVQRHRRRAHQAADRRQRRAARLARVRHSRHRRLLPRFGCTPALLDEIAAYAAKSGAALLPMREAFEALDGGASTGGGPVSAILPHVTVCVCTYKRPALLARLLDALARQATRGTFTYSLVVADNDERRRPRGSSPPSRRRRASPPRMSSSCGGTSRSRVTPP